MSILIKNMEMPSEGTFNIVHIYSDGRVAIPFWGKGMQVVQGIEAIPVPPHGKLGDLNALAQQIEHERFHHTHTDSLAARHHVAEYGHFLKAIIDAPTIIPASEEGET